MSNMTTVAHPSVEAYAVEYGNICLKQGEDKVITIPLENVTKVIDWLQILYKEQKHKITPDEFAAED